MVIGVLARLAITIYKKSKGNTGHLSNPSIGKKERKPALLNNGLYTPT
jgi:hypothetical protein